MSQIQRPPRSQRLVLHGVLWNTYRRLLRAFDEDRHVRITYDRGSLEIMTLSPLHERLKHLLGLLIMTLAVEVGTEILGFGSMTFKRRRKKRGLEPDECYYIQNEARMRGKDAIDLRSDPPPDLVVEVEVARSALNRLDIYAALGAPEVWRFDGEQLQVHLLGEAGAYAPSERSKAFPFLRPAELVRFVEQRKTLGEVALLKAFREWVAEQKSSEWGAAAPE
jgi:Uma2 family endonuclease